MEKRNKTIFASDSLAKSIGINDNPLESTWRLASDSGLGQIMITSVSVSAPRVPGFFSPLYAALCFIQDDILFLFILL